MKYFYRPSQSGHGTISPTPPSAGQRYRLHPHVMPKPVKWRPTMPQITIPKIPSRYFIWAFLIISAGCALWWGGNKAKELISHRQYQRQQAAVAQAQAAEESIKNEVKSQAKDAISAVRAGQNYLQNNDLQKAEAAFEIAIQYDSNWRDALVALADTQLQLEEYDAANTTLQKATEIDPLYPTTQQLFSVLYAKTDKPDAAKIASQKATYFAEKLGIALGG